MNKEFMLRVRITNRLNDMVNAAAARSGLNTADWVRGVLARAANEGAFAPRKGGTNGRKRKPAP